MATPGHVFWLFGLSGAGKSTLAGRLGAAFQQRGTPPLAIDGDELRAGLCRGLGFSDSDRAENIRRAAEVAKLGVLSGLPVVAAFITPLEAHRRIAVEVIGRAHITLVHVDATLAVCQARDVKGLYARARQGLVGQMTGVSSQFESPAELDLRIDTAAETVASSAARLEAFALRRHPPAT